MPDQEDSLGGATFSGEEHQDPVEQSLGDQPTFGDANTEDELIDDGMELVDLSTRYTEEGVLGKGGMGEVILATDTRLGRKVAIKRILGKAARSKTAVQRFLTEAKSMAELNHPNIVQIYDYGRAADGPFLIMECVQAGSLLDKCKAGPIELDEAVNIFGQLCDGLAKAHAAGIIHRDIKPANVLMTEDGVPKLTDFGLAKDDTADTGMTMEGAVIGTLDFMPPEQRQAAALTDHRSDLWSLAATFYQMLTGKSPKIIKFSNVPTQLQDALGKALEDEKDDRFQSALEMKVAVQQAATPELNAAGDLVAGEFPLTVIPKDFRQQVRQLFTEKYSREFKGFENLHMFPDLPGRKLANVLKSYAEGVSTDDILLLFDNTLLGSANDGFLMTEEAIYWHNAQGPFKTLELTALDHVSCETSMLVQELYLNHSDCIKINRLKPVETVTAMLKEIVSFKSGGLDRQGIVDGLQQNVTAMATPASAAVIEEPVNKGLPEKTEELASEPKQGPSAGPEQNVSAEATSSETSAFSKELKTFLQANHLGDGYYVGEEMPPKKLANIKKVYKLEPEEQIFAFIDCTLFGSAKDFVAITDKGIIGKRIILGKYRVDFEEFVSSELSEDGSSILITKLGGATELIVLGGSGLEVDSVFEFFENLHNKASELASK